MGFLHVLSVSLAFSHRSYFCSSASFHSHRLPQLSLNCLLSQRWWVATESRLSAASGKAFARNHSKMLKWAGDECLEVTFKSVYLSSPWCLCLWLSEYRWKRRAGNKSFWRILISSMPVIEPLVCTASLFVCGISLFCAPDVEFQFMFYTLLVPFWYIKKDLLVGFSQCGTTATLKP